MVSSEGRASSKKNGIAGALGERRTAWVKQTSEIRYVSSQHTQDLILLISREPLQLLFVKYLHRLHQIKLAQVEIKKDLGFVVGKGTSTHNETCCPVSLLFAE